MRTRAWIVSINAIIQNLFFGNLEWNLRRQVPERASPQERSWIQAPNYYDSIPDVLGKIIYEIIFSFTGRGHIARHKEYTTSVRSNSERENLWDGHTLTDI